MNLGVPSSDLFNFCLATRIRRSLPDVYEVYEVITLRIRVGVGSLD